MLRATTSLIAYGQREWSILRVSRVIELKKQDILKQPPEESLATNEYRYMSGKMARADSSNGAATAVQVKVWWPGYSQISAPDANLLRA